MTLREKDWRLLDTGHLTAAENMSIDEAILSAHAQDAVPPTLRFYGWQPAAVSIGYFQAMEKEVNLDAVRQGGWGYVRRPTGGRMIFHHLELTYSVVVQESLLPGGVVETYKELSRGLLAGLDLLGACPEMSGGESDPRRSDPGGFHTACFDTPSAYEMTVAGRKIAGSAQTRKEGVILQHGSILLDADVDLLFSLLRVPEGVEERLKARFRAKATTLKEALGRPVSYEEAREAFTHGFVSGLGLTMEAGALTEGELRAAGRLEREKYGSDTWNLKK